MASKLYVTSFALPSFMSCDLKDLASTESGTKTILISFYKMLQQHLFDCGGGFFVLVSDYVQVNPDKNLLVG